MGENVDLVLNYVNNCDNEAAVAGRDYLKLVVLGITVNNNCFN